MENNKNNSNEEILIMSEVKSGMVYFKYNKETKEYIVEWNDGKGRAVGTEKDKMFEFFNSLCMELNNSFILY